MPNPQKIYWESSVWIALIKGEVVNGVDRCEVPSEILKDAKDGKVTIYTSRLTIVEVHKKKKHSKLTEEEDNKIQSDFLEHEYIKKIDLDSGIAKHANKLAREYGIYPNDAIHVASAVRVKAEVLHHWDGDFEKIPLDIITCEVPEHWDKQVTLFT